MRRFLLRSGRTPELGREEPPPPTVLGSVTLARARTVDVDRAGIDRAADALIAELRSA